MRKEDRRIGSESITRNADTGTQEEVLACETQAISDSAVGHQKSGPFSVRDGEDPVLQLHCLQTTASTAPFRQLATTMYSASDWDLAFCRSTYGGGLLVVTY